MEIVLLLLLLIGFLSPVVYGFFKSNPQIIQRTKKIITAHTAAPVDPEKSQRELEASFKKLREAKQAEHNLLLNNWQDRYNSYLPEGDPERVALEVKASGINIEEANTLVMKQNELLISQRYRVIKAHAALRSNPSKDATLIGTLNGGTAIAIDGYVYGEKIGSTDIWFRIDDKDGVFATCFIWAGSTNDPEVGELPRVFAGPETPKSPAATRDLQREISRLNNQAASLPVSVKEMSNYKRAKRKYHEHVTLTAPMYTQYDTLPK